MQKRIIWGSVAVVLILWFGLSYNSLVTVKTKVDTGWAQVQNNYQSRFDLVPNLQSIVQGAANFEQETFVAVTEARTQWLNANSSGDRGATMQASNQFDSALSRLLVTVESYPQLRATENFRTFQSQLEGVENRIRVARMDYNNVVQAYNIAVRRFPRNLVARIFGFNEEKFFEAVSEGQVAPKVEF